MEYKALASHFIQARVAFSEHELGAEERALLEEQGQLTSIAVPHQDRVMELALEGREREAERILMQEALPGQDRVLRVLNRLRDISQLAAEEAAERTRTLQGHARLLIVGIALTVLLIGAAVALVVVLRVQSAAREREYLASHDTLTGLPNRALVLDRLAHALEHARRNERLVGVMFLDLDRFKVVNDTLGHAHGDRLLRIVAERIQHCVRASDTVGRLGGDEFVVVLEDLDSGDHAARVARKILDELTRHVAMEGREIYPNTSIGISLFPFDGDNAADLLKHADTAMYHAKEGGRGRYQFYLSEMSDHALRRLNYETRVRRAVSNGELDLHYQPIVGLRSGELVGVEALLRWQDAEFGSSSPEELVIVLEETGLIQEAGAWILDQACAQVRSWLDSGHVHESFRVAVNVSGIQFAAPGFVETVEGALARYGLKHRNLELEITEGVLMYNEQTSARALQRLREQGVQFSIDDFGTGYSSLSRLRSFPIDHLKIDRSFVANLDMQHDDRAMVKAIIAMGRSLGLRLIAEGVETRRQQERLRRYGCEEGQGFLFGRPVPSVVLTNRLAADFGASRAGSGLS
jgi:diguanylate cyclase (GGDEF)-like protein